MTYFNSSPAPGHSKSGFTLIELSIVLVVIGLILGIGFTSWSLIIEARSIAKTQSTLRQVKSCLLKRMTHSLQYPTYSDNLQINHPDAGTCVNDVPYRDVDACLCRTGANDVYGEKLHYVEGFHTDGSQDKILKEKFIIEAPYRGTSIEDAVPARDSSALTDGGNIQRVAFILISKGKDKEFDKSSYQECFDDIHDIVGSLKDCSPDFSNRHDDQILIITGQEIRGWMTD